MREILIYYTSNETYIKQKRRLVFLGEVASFATVSDHYAKYIDCSWWPQTASVSEAVYFREGLVLKRQNRYAGS